MKLFLLSIFLFSQLNLIAQNTESPVFVDYFEVIEELNKSSNPKNLEHKYEYSYLLILDSTCFPLVEKTGYYYLDEFRLEAKGLPLSRKTLGFRTDKRKIREIFEDEKSLAKIFNCINTEKYKEVSLENLHYPIYLKDNSAVFILYGPSWSNTYFASLNEGVLQINWITGIIE